MGSPPGVADFVLLLSPVYTPVLCLHGRPLLFLRSRSNVVATVKSTAEGTSKSDLILRLYGFGAGVSICNGTGRVREPRNLPVRHISFLLRRLWAPFKTQTGIIFKCFLLHLFPLLVLPSRCPCCPGPRLFFEVIRPSWLVPTLPRSLFSSPSSLLLPNLNFFGIPGAM